MDYVWAYFVVIIVGVTAAYALFSLISSAQSTPMEFVNVTAGERISNFLITGVNQMNVTGILYVEYPLAMKNGTYTTITMGESVGYACDGTLAKLIMIKSKVASFALNKTKSRYGCPI